MGEGGIYRISDQRTSHRPVFNGVVEWKKASFKNRLITQHIPKTYYQFNKNQSRSLESPNKLKQNKVS